MADTAENILFNEFENIESVFIHVEPEKEKIEIAVIPVQDQNGLESRLHQYFGRAPWFMILTLGNGKIQAESCLENRFAGKQVHVGLNVVKSIIDHRVNLLFVSSIGEISFHYLKNHYVDIFKIDEVLTVREIIRLYRENRLSPMTRPGLPVQNF
jgi:predicted Fe-Mo cluster-binding NifX family protein